jgi:hypothetical protein
MNAQMGFCDALCADCPAVKTLTKRQRETATRRAEGRCIICGQPSAQKATCDDCGQRANEYRKANRKKNS